MIKDELAGILLFEGLSDEKLTECANFFKTEDVLMGEKLTKEDDFGYSLVIIIRGSVAVRVGQDVVAELHAGDHFGEVSLIEHQKRNASVVALESCHVAKVMTWDFEKFLAVDPVIKERLDAAVQGDVSAGPRGRRPVSWRPRGHWTWVSSSRQ